MTQSQAIRAVAAAELATQIEGLLAMLAATAKHAGLDHSGEGDRLAGPVLCLGGLKDWVAANRAKFREAKRLVRREWQEAGQ